MQNALGKQKPQRESDSYVFRLRLSISSISALTARCPPSLISGTDCTISQDRRMNRDKDLSSLCYRVVNLVLVEPGIV